MYSSIQARAAAFLFIMGISATLFANNSNDSIRSTAFFEMDACYANINSGAYQDYSEFTAEIENGESCSTLEIVGGNLYRDFPFMNSHSCTAGVGGTPAMCVSADAGCGYNAGSQRSVRINIRVTPGVDGIGSLSSIEF